MKAKYPKYIFVKREKENDGSSYLLACESATESADVNGEVEVAQYKLDQLVVIKANVEVVKKGSF